MSKTVTVKESLRLVEVNNANVRIMVSELMALCVRVFLKYCAQVMPGDARYRETVYTFCLACVWPE